MRPLILCSAVAVLFTAGCNYKTDQQTKTKTSDGQTSTAPSGTAAAKRDQALVRFVNADTRTPTADVWFGDQRPFSNVPYKGVTAYTPLPDDRRTFKLRAAGSTEDLATNNEGLSEGRRYTFVAMRDRDGKARLTAVDDNLSPPTEGKAKVRVINGASRVGEVSLAAAGEKSEIVDDLNFGNSSDFKEVDTSNATLEIRRRNARTPAVHLTGLRVQPGRIYTIIVTGEQALDTIHIEDQLGQQSAAVR